MHAQYSVHLGSEVKVGTFVNFRQGIRSSCHSEGSSEGWASAPGWSPGPSDPEPACEANAPGKRCALLNKDEKTDKTQWKEITEESW